MTENKNCSGLLNRLRKIALAFVTTASVLSLTGCGWDDLDNVLNDPRAVVTEVGERNKQIISDYQMIGLLTTDQANSLKQSIQEYVDTLIGGDVDNFTDSIKMSVVDVVSADDLEAWKGSNYSKVECEFQSLAADEGIVPVSQVSPLQFQAQGFSGMLEERINKRIYVLNPNLSAGEFSNCVTACKAAVNDPKNYTAITTLVSTDKSYFKDSGKTLTNFDAEDLYQASESNGVQIGDLETQTKNKINQDIAISGPVKYTDNNGNETVKNQVLLILRVSELSKKFQDSIDLSSQTKNKYLMPDISGVGTKDAQDLMNKIFLMEYPVSVLDNVQLGTPENRVSGLGGNQYALIFKEDPYLKVNLASGEMIYGDKKVNDESEESERIYRVSGSNPSFSFYKNGGTQTNVQVDQVTNDITLKKKVPETDDPIGEEVDAPDYFKEIFGTTKTTYALETDEGLVKLFISGGSTQGKSGEFDIPEGYLGVSKPGEDSPYYLVKYHKLSGTGPSLIFMSFNTDVPDQKYPEEVSSILSAVPGSQKVNSANVSNFNKEVSYFTVGPEGESPTSDELTSRTLEDISSDWDYDSVSITDEDRTGYYNQYFLSIGSDSNNHANFEKMQYLGFTGIPSAEELGLTDSDYEVFLSSPEIRNVAAKLAIEKNDGSCEFDSYYTVDYEKKSSSHLCSKQLPFWFVDEDEKVYEYLPIVGVDGPATGTVISKDDVDQTKISKDSNGSWIYDYNGTKYYCSSPTTAGESKAATIILTDYLELTYLPGVVDDEPFIATGRRVRLTEPNYGTTSVGEDVQVAVFTDKLGNKMVGENSDATVITIGDLVDRTSGTGYYDSVGEKLGIGGLFNSDEVQADLDKALEDRVDELKEIFDGDIDSDVDGATSDTGLIGDTHLLKYSAYFNYIEPVMEFATSSKGNVPALAGVDASKDKSHAFWGICVDTNAFDTHLYTDWIAIEGDGGDNGSLNWWNSWLASNGFGYKIDLDRLKEMLQTVYSASISEKDDVLVLNLETINSVNNIMENRNVVESEKTNATVFKVIGVFLFGYGLLLGLLWLLDVNLVNGPNFLTFATFGKMVAISDRLDFPEYANNGKSYVTLPNLLVFILGIWFLGALLIIAPVSNIWDWAMALVQKLFDYVRDLMFGTL